MRQRAIVIDPVAFRDAKSGAISSPLKGGTKQICEKY